MAISPKVHATSTTVNKVSSAMVTSIEAIPNAKLPTTFGGTEAQAGVALARKLVEAGYDLETKLDLPAVNAKILGACV